MKIWLPTKDDCKDDLKIIYFDIIKDEQALWINKTGVAGNFKFKKTDSINSVLSTVKSQSLWITL